MQRFNQRQGFLVSAAIHLTLLMILIAHPPSPRRPAEIDPASFEKTDRVFLPPASVLRQVIPLAPRPAEPTPPPEAQPRREPLKPATPPPTPPPGKDRISIGAPGAPQSKGPILLTRDTDLTRQAKGAIPEPPEPTPPPAPAPPVSGKPGPEPTEKLEGRKEIAGREGLRLPEGLGRRTASGAEGQRGSEGRPEVTRPPGVADPRRPGTALDRSVEAAVDQVARRLQTDSRLGIPTGTGKDISGLHFDPQGADFTLWVQRFKDEIYRNWVLPQSALLGVVRGHADFEFTVERDGTMSALRLLKSSGTPSLDRASEHALAGSLFLPLPDDYRPPRVTMQITFFYNEGPVGS